MNTPILSRRIIAACLAAAALLFPAASHAVLLTYDMRVVSSSSGNPITDPHIVILDQPGEVFTLQLYAIVNGADNDHTNDGFLRGSGSFVSLGTLGGTVRGDILGGGTTLQNNVAAFSGSGAQSGFQADLDGDGDLDVGSLVQTGNPAGPPWFVAMGTNQQTQFGAGAGPGSTEFLIGQTTFTVIPNPVFGAVVYLIFEPQIKTDGTPGDDLPDQFTIDGVPTALAGNDSNVATVGAEVVVTDAIGPEPSACALLLCGVSALAGFRRRR